HHHLFCLFVLHLFSRAPPRPDVHTLSPTRRSSDLCCVAIRVRCTPCRSLVPRAPRPNPPRVTSWCSTPAPPLNTQRTRSTPRVGSSSRTTPRSRSAWRPPPTPTSPSDWVNTVRSAPNATVAASPYLRRTPRHPEGSFPPKPPRTSPTGSGTCARCAPRPPTSTSAVAPTSSSVYWTRVSTPPTPNSPTPCSRSCRRTVCPERRSR